MIARYVQKGEAIDYRPTEAVSAGEVIVQGNLIGIARLDIAANTLGALAIVGAFDIEKTSSLAIPVGTALYWDATNKKATTTATGNQYLGKAILESGAEDETVRVLLNAPFVATA